MDANRQIAAALVACLLATGVAAQTTTRKAVRKHRVAETTDATSPLVRQAETAIEKRDFETAEAKLKAATAADARDYQAWFYLGYVYAATVRDQEAIAAYKRAAALKPDVFETNLNLGVLLARHSQPEAETYLRAATRAKPLSKPQEGLTQAWMALGRLLVPKQPEEALAAFREAAKLSPKEAEPRFSAAILLEAVERYPEAEAEFRAALALDPKSREALAGLVNTVAQQKRFPEAEKLLRQYLEAEPTNGVARAQLGRVLAAQGRFEEAVAELEAGMQSAADPALERELAAVYMETKRYDQAAALYAAAVPKSPRDADLRYGYGTALLHQLKYPEAQAQLLEAVKLNPRLGEAYGELAVAASANKNHQLVIQALDARARFLPEEPRTLFLRALSFDHLKLFPQASEYYRQFLAAAGGKFPNQEFQARQRLKVIEPERK